MTVGLIASVANSFLDSTFDTSPTLKIHTGDPGAAGTANVSAGDNTAKTVAFNAASGGSKSKTATNPQWTNGGTSETISHLSLLSSAAVKATGALTTPQAWAATNTFTLTTLTISITPIAA